MIHRSRSLLAIAVVSAIWQLPAQAEESSARVDDDTRLGTVLVTGTRALLVQCWIRRCRWMC